MSIAPTLGHLFGFSCKGVRFSLWCPFLIQLLIKKKKKKYCSYIHFFNELKAFENEEEFDQNLKSLEGLKPSIFTD